MANRGQIRDRSLCSLPRPTASSLNPSAKAPALHSPLSASE